MGLLMQPHGEPGSKVVSTFPVNSKIAPIIIRISRTSTVLAMSDFESQTHFPKGLSKEMVLFTVRYLRVNM